MLNRRDFLKCSATALPLASSPALGRAAGLLAEPRLVAQPLAIRTADELSRADTKPWVQTVQRVGQLNFTEHDCVDLNLDAWADYWKETKTDIVAVSVTGIVAYYPSQVPYFRHAKYLNNRDVFGECVAAARKRGVRVFARMSPDLNWPEALQAHPEWFQRNEDGSPQHTPDRDDLFRTCMFTGYFTDYMVAIMRELNQRYDIDAMYTNGWPEIGKFPECWCSVCKNLPRPDTTAYWDVYNKRVRELWTLWDGIAKDRNPTSFYFANLGGHVHEGPNLDLLGELAQWFHSDMQGRYAHDAPVWGSSIQGRVCAAVMRGKLSVQCTAMYATGGNRWRNTAKSAPETFTWFNQALATGMKPDIHWVGAETGMGEDRRWMQHGREYNVWMSRHDQHWQNRQTVANVAVLIGQRSHLFYKLPRNTKDEDWTNGLYAALLEGRFAWDFLHEDNLTPDRLKKYRAVLLPNTALLSDIQCKALADYVSGGGSLYGSFQTSLFDESNSKRQDFGLAEVFGIHAAGEIVPTRGNPYYARIENPKVPHHPVLTGFDDTNWLPGSEHRQPLAPVSNPLMTVVPGYTAYPPELSYPPTPHTDEPALVVREHPGGGRTAFFSGDIERTYYNSGNTDLGQLLINVVRWLSYDERPFDVQGPGLIEAIAWETEPGYALHLINYTNPNTMGGWLHHDYPLAPQTVRLQLPAGVKIKRAELLRAGHDVPAQTNGQTLTINVPAVGGHEVVALYRS